MAKPCIIKGCENEASSKSLLCKTCRHGLYYWHKKSPSQVLERKRKLIMYTSRLTSIEKPRPKS